MPNLYDIAYAIGFAAAAPYWLAVSKARRKVFKALRGRMGRHEQQTPPGPDLFQNKLIFIHAVSLGEINATRAMIRLLADTRPDLRFVVSVTTETGHARGVELYGSDPRVTLIRYPLDFSRAICRVLNAFRPSVVVLMELEVWPNFILHCHRRGIPVLLVNGRLTTYSFKNYRKLRRVLAPTFSRLSAVCAQDKVFAERFIALGTPEDRVRVTGTMKFDTAQVADKIGGQEELGRALALDNGPQFGTVDPVGSALRTVSPDVGELVRSADPTRAAHPIWVCGSTGPGEEPMILRAYRTLVSTHPELRLVIVPRHPERFDPVATLIRDEGFAVLRRSENRGAAPTTPTAPANGQSPVILGDTMGELRKFYSLATVVFVGRSLVDLGPRQHGSDMIEPAALAKPVVVGPWTHNFAEATSRFVNAQAMQVVAGEPELADAVGRLLSDPAEARAMGLRAQAVVRAEQGATARHVELILYHLDNRPGISENGATTIVA